MYASLPMYNHSSLSDSNQRFWELIRTKLLMEGISAPQKLTADGFGLDFWSSTDLVFSQTCGMPYRSKLIKKVQLIGTPDYGVEGCPAGFYKSVLIKRKDDTRSRLSDFSGAVVAINEFGSQSGFASLANEIANTDIRFGSYIQTGGHIVSAHAVATKQAEFAAIDAVTWQILLRTEEMAADLDVFETTAPTPSLPFICALNVCKETVFRAVSEAIDELTLSDRKMLMLRSLVKIPKSAYTAVPTPTVGENERVDNGENRENNER